MRKHVKSFTYEPKIPAVWDGKVCQTIRPLNLDYHLHYDPHKIAEAKVDVGDQIMWHTWTGRPYRSKWGESRLITEIIEEQVIKIYIEGIVFRELYGGDVHGWGKLDWLAKDDGIDPPTGEELGRYFNGNYKLMGSIHAPPMGRDKFGRIQPNTDYRKYFQIVKWDGNKIRKEVVN